MKLLQLMMLGVVLLSGTAFGYRGGYYHHGYCPFESEAYLYRYYVNAECCGKRDCCNVDRCCNDPCYNRYGYGSRDAWEYREPMSVEGRGQWERREPMVERMEQRMERRDQWAPCESCASPVLETRGQWERREPVMERREQRMERRDQWEPQAVAPVSRPAYSGK